MKIPLVMLLALQVIGAFSECRSGLECLVYEMNTRFKVNGPRPECRNGEECLTHNGTRLFKEYESRQYPFTRWISTSLTTHSFGEAYRVLTQRIISYKNGKNSKNMTIGDTVPLRVRLKPCICLPPCVTSYIFILSLLLPSNLTNPPQPEDSNLFFEEIPTQTYMLRAFAGKLDERKCTTEHFKLSRSTQIDLDADQIYYYEVWYGKIYQLVVRTNEIWVTKNIPQEIEYFNQECPSPIFKGDGIVDVDEIEINKTLEEHKTVEKEKTEEEEDKTIEKEKSVEDKIVNENKTVEDDTIKEENKTVKTDKTVVEDKIVKEDQVPETDETAEKNKTLKTEKTDKTVVEDKIVKEDEVTETSKMAEGDKTVDVSVFDYGGSFPYFDGIFQDTCELRELIHRNFVYNEETRVRYFFRSSYSPSELEEFKALADEKTIVRLYKCS